MREFSLAVHEEPDYHRKGQCLRACVALHRLHALNGPRGYKRAGHPLYRRATRPALMMAQANLASSDWWQGSGQRN